MADATRTSNPQLSELQFLRGIAENVERIACWTDQPSVYLEVRRMRDEIFERNKAPKLPDEKPTCPNCLGAGTVEVVRIPIASLIAGHQGGRTVTQEPCSECSALETDERWTCKTCGKSNYYGICEGCGARVSENGSGSDK